MFNQIDQLQRGQPLEVILRNQNKILEELRQIREEIKRLGGGINNNETIENIDFNNEFINVDKDMITKSLKYHDIYYDCKILKEYYLKNKGNLPIITINSRMFKYRYNNKWIIDYGGANIKNILSNSIRNTYTKYNTINNYDDMNIFILNQAHIKKLTKPKYKNQLFREFINEVSKLEK